MRVRFLLPSLLAAGLVLGVAPLAGADPDQSGSSVISSPDFPGVCGDPCFTATKTFEVFLSTNTDADNPNVCAGADNTYVYKITHDGGAGPFVPALTRFETSVEADDVSSAGFISGFGIDPSNTTVDGTVDVVRWDFASPSISDGGMSTKLYVCSPLGPGAVTDTMVSIDGQLSLDASGTCVGPVVPVEGDPLPCTIGFWKNRADGKKGTLQHFSDAEFALIVDTAVLLSGGEFVDAADLLAALTSKGNRTQEERARQQLAALLLNFAAADEVPDNDKCRVFDGNLISSNACGTNLTMAEALDVIFANLDMGFYEMAKDCADDINNGIGVVTP
ncbi:MAG TPA: hypothetical protein VLL48_10085 [Longimicrobiales bacterium]|nr:hypothetical protein [Longimicrobiales bacterium]